ncbi:hypothetical protein OAD19_00040 [Octadecabacter sp.]|nr:hypothetical protein [Octadecabacter sp.]
MIRSLVISLMLFVGAPSIGLTQSDEPSNWYYENVSEDEDDILSLILSEFEASISVGTPECLGDFSGVVTKHDDRLTVIDPNRRLRGPECEFTLWPQGDRAFLIEQGEGCTPYHGATCSLQGYVELQSTSQPSNELTPITTVAASFDCDKAATETETEIAICADPELAKTDRILALVYQSTLGLLEAELLPSDSADLLNSQRRWLGVRNSCADDANCLAEAYSSQLMHLTEAWIGQSYDVIWPLISSEATIQARTDTYHRSILLSEADDTNGIFENIFIFDRAGLLTSYSFQYLNNACTNNFRYANASLADALADTFMLDTHYYCGSGKFSGSNSYQLNPTCIELVRLSEYNELYGVDRSWLPSEDGFCAESLMLAGYTEFWYWGANAEIIDPIEYSESTPSVNFLDVSRRFIDYWESPLIQPVKQEDLLAYRYSRTCAADDLTVSYVKLINFYHNLPFNGDEHVRFSESVADWDIHFGYTDLLRSDDNKPSGFFAALMEEYLQFEWLTRPLLVMTLRALNQEGAVSAVINDLVQTYDYEENPSPDYPNTFFPCEDFKITNGPLYDITYWRGFDAFGFWERRRADGTSEFVFETLTSLRDDVEFAR